ncbi:MAG TPA: two-component regulator propeller domain-containing protein, partial [Draconibacterium sp.]|nr:two-component regulator propeller domain-containing protein [Draconibacterium sp.]
MSKIFLKSVCVCLLVLFVSFGLQAQNRQLTFERITAEQGLTSNRINGIVQDKEGFIWIATNNGLNRYDGVENKQYTKQQDDTTSLSNNSVLALYCDSANQLWILTINYLHRYNRKLDNFDRFLLSNKKESYRYENKGMIKEDSTGKIWIGTPTSGLFFFNSQTNSCEKVLPEINSVSSLYFDNTGKLWIGGENGALTKYDLNTGSAKTFQISSGLRRPIKDDFIWQIWQDHPNNINLFLTSGFFRFDFETETFSELKEWNRLVNYTDNE